MRRNLPYLALILVAATGLARPAFSQNGYGPDCWIDAGTGQPAQSLTWPISAQWPGLGGDFSRGYDARTGRNFVRTPDGSWIDAATRSPVPTLTWPVSAQWPGLGGDFTRAYDSRTGRNFVRVPCAPPPQPTQATPGPSIAPFAPGIGFGFGFGGAHGDDRRDRR
jgi:hypothetical protein